MGNQPDTALRGAVQYAPHPFHWLPAAGARHASADSQQLGHRYAPGAEVTTLCDKRVKAESGEIAWLWETCPDCNAAAHVLARCPMPPVAGAR